MRHTSRKRSAPDPLKAIDATTWLVARDRMSFVIESTELAPGTNLRAALSAARNARITAGWVAEAIGASCSFFFATRSGERVMVGIERVPPRNPVQ
jgi:hypothetical protein